MPSLREPLLKADTKELGIYCLYDNYTPQSPFRVIGVIVKNWIKLTDHCPFTQDRLCFKSISWTIRSFTRLKYWNSVNTRVQQYILLRYDRVPSRGPSQKDVGTLWLIGQCVTYRKKSSFAVWIEPKEWIPISKNNFQTYCTYTMLSAK